MSIRWLAIGLNIVGLLGATYLLNKHGFPKDPEETLIVIQIFAIPSISLLALIFGSDHTGQGWLALYLRRKRLEENIEPGS